jgi:hypothetical protein
MVGRKDGGRSRETLDESQIIGGVYRDANPSEHGRGRAMGRGADGTRQHLSQIRGGTFGVLRFTTHTDIPGARSIQTIRGYKNANNAQNEAKDGKQPDQRQNASAKGIVGKSNENRTPHLPGTAIQKNTLGTHLFSDIARADIPQLNDTSRSKTISTPQSNFVGKAPLPWVGKATKKTGNFGGIPPSKQTDGMAYTPALQPGSRRGPIIEGGSDETVLKPIIQSAIDMPRQVPPPSILPPRVFRPVKPPATAIAPLQESSQSSRGAATSHDVKEAGQTNTPSGRYTRLASTSSSGSPTSQPAQPPAAVVPPSSPMQRDDGNLYDRNKTEGEKETIRADIKEHNMPLGNRWQNC